MGRKSREKREAREIIATFVARPTTRFEDIRWGVGFGLAFAAVFSAYVLVVAALRGPDAFVRLGLSTWQIISTYAVTGALAGAAAGILRKYGARSPGRARIAGAVVGSVIYTSVGVVLFGPRPLPLISGTIAGVPLGFLVTVNLQRKRVFEPLPPLLNQELRRKLQEHYRAAKLRRRA